jgi:hypothetical protein
MPNATTGQETRSTTATAFVSLGPLAPRFSLYRASSALGHWGDRAVPLLGAGPNTALEATGHSVRFVVGTGLYGVARASAWAFGFKPRRQKRPGCAQGREIMTASVRFFCKGFSCTLPILSGYRTSWTNWRGSITSLLKRLLKSSARLHSTVRCRKGISLGKTCTLPVAKPRRDGTLSSFSSTSPRRKPFISARDMEAKERRQYGRR